MSSPRASLIVSTWNGRHLLEDCLPRLLRALAFAGGDHELIVVDDASADDTVEFVRREYPQVKLLALERNLRFAGANNAAAAIATGDVLLFLNNDMLVEEDFLPPLLSHFSDPDVFAVTAYLQMQPRLTPQGLIRETGLVRGRFAGGTFVLQHDDPETDDPIPVIYAGGGSSAWRKEWFLRLGGFDRLFYPFYFEDLDVSYRGQKQGGKLLFEPRSRMEHKHQQTNNPTNFPPGYVELMFARNNLLFQWKVLTDPAFLRAHFTSLWRALLRHRAHPRLARAFLHAAAKLPQLLAHRHRARRGLLLTDQEVFARTAPRAQGEPRVSALPSSPPPSLPRLLADVLAKTLLRRRAASPWGLDAAPRNALLLRAGSPELVAQLADRLRAHFPEVELTLLTSEVLALSPSSLRALRAKRFDTAFVAGEGNRRAELIALLTARRRLEVRHDGAAHTFSLALYQPLLLLLSGLLRALESVALTALLALVWGSLALEGEVWGIRRAMGTR